MAAIHSTITARSESYGFWPAVLPRDCGDGDLGETLGALGDFFTSLGKLAAKFNGADCGCRCGLVEPPDIEDSCHPPGSLRVDQEAGVITTPGGYKIEQIGQYEWKITGPDGTWTRVWGDPHVQEGDRSCDASAWDFKRDSTFVLPDGTRINVTTKAYGEMTVTSGLEVICDNDRVLVTGIDQGKGQVGEVTHDGFDHVNDFCGKDVFVMGREADDWYLRGREVLASFNGGESFDLGKSSPEQTRNFLNDLEGFALRLMASLFNDWPTSRDAEASRRRERISDDILAVNQLFRTIAGLRELSDQVSYGRSFQMC